MFIFIFVSLAIVNKTFLNIPIEKDKDAYFCFQIGFHGPSTNDEHLTILANT